MSHKKIESFQDMIRHMFIMEAIIPVFCITVACVLLFYGTSYYTVETTNSSANKKISNEIGKTLHAYQAEILNLSEDVSLAIEQVDTERLVEIRREMYELATSLGYEGKLYILNVELQPMLLGEEEVPAFMISNTCDDWGIIRAIKQQPSQMSIRIMSTEEDKLLCMGSGIRSKGKLVGYVVITVSANEFTRLITHISPQTIIADENGWVYLANNYVFEDSLGRFERSIKRENGFFQYNDQRYYMSCNTLCNGRLQVYTITNNEMRMRMFGVLCIFVFFIFIGIIGITYLMSGKVAKKSTADIDDIAKAFEEMKKGNLDCYLRIGSSKEFKEIGEAYNLMLDGLKHNIQEKDELTKNIAFAQVKQLEAQFNPHFLFNTLDNIRFMSRIDLDASDQMIVALSTLLRYSISNVEEEIRVEEDIHYTQSYLDILKIRFNRRLTYELTIDDNIRNCLIPKLLIQPLIENAVKYGYKNQDTLTVKVSGYREDGDLVFRCEDDGAGMEPEVLERICNTLRLAENTSGHLGIYNVHRRIQLLYHKDYGIHLASEVGKGTIVTIRLPIKET